MKSAFTFSWERNINNVLILLLFVGPFDVFSLDIYLLKSNNNMEL